MDPLTLTMLPLTENWNTFAPDMKGYIPPQQLALCHPDLRDFEAQIKHFTCNKFWMRDNGAPFISKSVAQGFPSTSLTIRGESFTVPLPSREIAFLGAHLGSAGASRHTVLGDKVTNLNSAARSAILQSQDAVLEELQTIGDFITYRTLETLEVFKAGSHALSTARSDNNHFVTIFVILPSFTGSDHVRFHATNESITSQVKLPKDISQTVHAIGVYTGVSGARIEVGAGSEIVCLTYHISLAPTDDPCVVPQLEYLSGALPPLRDAVCLWRHALNSGASAPALMLFFLDGAPESAGDFESEDATLLCHLAPLAKAYGFNIYIGELVHIRSTRQEVYHSKGSGYTVKIKHSILHMSGTPHVQYEWERLRTLGGVRVNQRALLDLATQMVTTDFDLNYEWDQLPFRKEHEIEEELKSSVRVIFKHVKEGSFLFIAP